MAPKLRFAAALTAVLIGGASGFVARPRALSPLAARRGRAAARRERAVVGRREDGLERRDRAHEADAVLEREARDRGGELELHGERDAHEQLQAEEQPPRPALVVLVAGQARPAREEARPHGLVEREEAAEP